MDALPFDKEGNKPPDNYRMLNPTLPSQVVTFTPGTSAQSAAFAATTKLIAVMHDHSAPATVLTGSNPTALAGSHAVKNGEVVFIKVTGGEKIAVR